MFGGSPIPGFPWAGQQQTAQPGFDRPLPQLPQRQVAPASVELGELCRRLGLDLTALANKLRALFESPSSLVQQKTVTILAGATSATIEHGLGRAYRGAVITGQSGAGAAYVLLPTSADASTTLTVGILTAPVADLTIELWVY